MTEPRLSVAEGARRDLPRGNWADLFARRASRSPARVGLVADGVVWTFRDLDAWSNRLARVLREAGAGPGAVVVCAMTRSARAVLTLPAVAKTGAVHAPVDPALPPARIAAILADARPAVVVTDVPALSARADVVLDPEGWLGDLDCRSPEPLPRPATTGPAYLVYTSGSTGQPKGVLVGHSSLVNLHSELEATVFPADARPRRVAHGLPLSFDASWDPLLWLVGGHEVHLLPEAVRVDPERYVRFVRDHRVAVVEAVPAHLVSLLDAGLLAADDRPELVLTGGEAVSRSLWARLRATPRLSAMNLYGPTECTVFTTSCPLAERAAPAIGRPIGNTRAAVVDDELRPVPVGAPGELLISGACLALGYAGRPELTAERFVTEPYRAYRTGDLCRMLPDGHLEWLGRLDDQVKIRGHRVEPGEVEHVLLGQPDIRQAVVVTDQAGAGLVAYVVPDGNAVDGAEVRGRLRRLLPEYLVPTTVVTLDRLPLGRHGKVDRAALPATAATVPRPTALSAAEEVVAGQFRCLLGVPAVGADSDFFALGGHSLSAAALASRLRALGVPCALRDVLRLRTVARIAELVPTARQGARQ